MESHKKTSIVARTIGSGISVDPRFTGIIAYDKNNECAEIIAETSHIPPLAATLISCAQEGLQRLSPEEIRDNWETFAAASMEARPLARDLALSPDGRILAINVGIGVLYFQLSGKLRETVGKTGSVPFVAFDRYPWRWQP